MLDIKEIYKAQENIEGIIHKTTMEKSNTFSKICGGEVYLKYENQQRTGSFKIRGAYNKIVSLNEKERKKGVIAASAGNHAQGVALAAKLAGIKAVIVMPRNAPLSKINATEGYGAQVVLYGDCYDDAYDKASEIQKENQMTFIHAFNDYDIMAGQGVIGLEIIHNLPETGVIIAPIGGGGLLSGISVAVKSLKPDVSIIGVEAENAASYKASKKEGKCVVLKDVYTIADGIAIKSLGDKTFSILNRYVDDVVTVNDEEISSAILLLMEREKQLVEGSGAVGLAALINHKIDVKNKKAVCLLTGGNIDMNFINKIIEKGLIKAGRNINIRTVVPDRPGMLNKITEIIASEGGNILNIYHDRYDKDLSLDTTIIHIRLETNNIQHGEKIVDVLREKGYKIL
jgi:threonine dehydratase